MTKFRFITFEGIEGCGKSTQAKKLYDYFLANQIDSLLTREPGGTKVGEKIREILIDDSIDKLSAKTELLLNFSARIEHVQKVILPAIEKNKIVICDRFFDSTFAYQGGAMGLPDEQIDNIKNFAIENFSPDITFLINISVDEGLSRVASRLQNNRYDKLGKDFHQKVQEKFLALAKKNSRIKIIDGHKNPSQVFAEILSHLQ
jgi:dTMP kinase